MATEKIAITIDRELLSEVDRLVARGSYPNRSRAIQIAVREKIGAWRKNRLVQELKKLDSGSEAKLADERLKGERWPEF